MGEALVIPPGTELPGVSFPVVAAVAESVMGISYMGPLASSANHFNTLSRLISSIPAEGCDVELEEAGISCEMKGDT